MLSFAHLDRLIGSVPGPVVARLRRIDTGRGREDLYRNQLPALLTELAHRARVESITASSALEGVVVPDDPPCPRRLEVAGRHLARRHRPFCCVATAGLAPMSALRSLPRRR